MAFWTRINQSKIKILSNQFMRYYVQIPFNSPLNCAASGSSSVVSEKPVCDFVKRPDFWNNVRFFAARVQAKVQKEEKDTSGPRMNEQITAQVVRLVTDEGHHVVSLHEALAQARRLDLDLVEVQRNAEPAVCKLMDFHREQYTREKKEKERAKSQAGEKLRSGGHKEVRFTAKCEQKDLKMKADMVIRLMDRGYRVKCMAVPILKKQSSTKSKGDEDPEIEEFERLKLQQELQELLSRLTALIKDVAIVESGPFVEKRQAFVVVRHVKFGPPKKGGGAKKDKAVAARSTADPSERTGSPGMFEEEPAEFSMDAEDDPTNDFDKVFDISDDEKGPTLDHSDNRSAVLGPASSGVKFSAPNFSHTRSAHDAEDAGRLRSSQPQPPPVIENRYKRSEPRNQFSQTPMYNRGPGEKDSFRFEPQFSNQRTQPQPQMNGTRTMGERKQGITDPPLRNTMPPHETPKKEASSPDAASPGSSYGIFSSAKASVPGFRNSNSAGTGPNSNLPNSKSHGGQMPGDDQGRQQNFGMFSRDIPKKVQK